MNRTIEQFVAETILEKTIPIQVADKTYQVAPPSTATLIDISALVSRIPDLTINEDADVMSTVLANAHRCDFLGDLAAILILGRKYTIVEKKWFFGLIKRTIDNKKRLSKLILETLDPEDLQMLIIELLQRMKVSFFLGITIFLREVNLTKPMKGMTASGQPLPESVKNTT